MNENLSLNSSRLARFNPNFCSKLSNLLVQPVVVIIDVDSHVFKVFPSLLFTILQWLAYSTVPVHVVKSKIYLTMIKVTTKGKKNNNINQSSAFK